MSSWNDENRWRTQTLFLIPQNDLEQLQDTRLSQQCPACLLNPWSHQRKDSGMFCKSWLQSIWSNCSLWNNPVFTLNLSRWLDQVNFVSSILKCSSIREWGPYASGTWKTLLEPVKGPISWIFLFHRSIFYPYISLKIDF